MTEENQSSAVRKHNNKWRVVDIVVAAIIAVASGVIFWGWDIVCTAPLALFAYKKWDLLSTTISGALAGVGCGLYYWLTNPAWSALRVSIYLIASAISGAVLAGAVMYLLQVAIAKTGVLDRF